MEPWTEDLVIAPARLLLESLKVGHHTVDRDACQQLDSGIDWCFMAEASAQYDAWPSGSTTDGTVVDLITRMDETTLEAIGMTYIDFGGAVFPSRVVITVEEFASSIIGFIGQTDDRTGAPPRFPPGTLINTPRDSDTGVVMPTLIIGRREVLPEWTRAFTLSVTDGSTGHGGSIRLET